MKGLPKPYGELAPWFHLLTHPKSYAGEARYVVRTLRARRATRKPTMLELGSGGGNNAFHLKRRFSLTLTDISPRMLALSRSINPECEHIVGDMRKLRLKRQFDFVFAHDAITYMTSERDLARAIKTAFVHLKPGGTALFQPDFVRESFAAGRGTGGHRQAGRRLRYVEITRPLAPQASTTEVDFTVTLTEADGGKRVVTDRHRIGVFPRATWLKLLRDAGLRARCVSDPWRRACFLCRRPRRARA